MFIVLLTSIVHASSDTKYVSISNQCKNQPNLISLHPNEYSHELHCYPFVVKLEDSVVVILLMTYLINYVFQIKQKI